MVDVDTDQIIPARFLTTTSKDGLGRNNLIGLDKVFEQAGAEWRKSGCSMCIGMNGDTVPSGNLSVSTSNRNFEGRQGIGARTVLASPMTAAASAIEGHVCDPRPYLERQ